MTGRLATLQVLALIAASSCILAWFGWWQRELYIAIPQHAVLEELRFDGGEINRTSGQVTWRIDDHRKKGLGLIAEVTVPQKGLSVWVSLRENRDPDVEASHVIEIRQRNTRSARDRIEGMSLPLMTVTRDGSGRPVTGVVTQVGEHRFRIALSPAEPDMVVNMGLLRGARRIELPLAFDSGLRAKLTFNAGSPGRALMRSAMLSWAT